MMTQEWQDQWNKGKADTARKAIPFQAGEAVWVCDVVPPIPLTANMIKDILERKFPAKIVAHHPRRWWRKERYTVEFSTGNRKKVERWRITKAGG